jgi:hypothetical protein
MSASLGCPLCPLRSRSSSYGIASITTTHGIDGFGHASLNSSVFGVEILSLVRNADDRRIRVIHAMTVIIVHRIHLPMANCEASRVSLMGRLAIPHVVPS